MNNKTHNKKTAYKVKNGVHITGIIRRRYDLLLNDPSTNPRVRFIDSDDSMLVLENKASYMNTNREAYFFIWDSHTSVSHKLVVTVANQDQK
jgi:hypothetical protein